MPVHNGYKARVLNELTSVTVKAALLTNVYVPNVDDDNWNDVVANEVVGTGYTAGGQALASKVVTQNNVADRGEFDAADVNWPVSTITARYLVVYIDTGVPATSTIIAIIDFGSDRSSTAADFTIEWNALGILHAA